MYYNRLDSLRFYAVMAVLFSHFFSYVVTKYIYVGVAGVDLFFVISGFLITEILFSYRDKKLPLGAALKKFYIRRSLRIFPIYYLHLIVVALLFFVVAKPALLWAFAYLVNFYQQNHETPKMFIHLWSLSVEEQFYLFWPILILVVPKKHSLKLIIIAIATAVLSRIFITGINHKLLTTSCMDAFGIGALLAYYKTYNIEKAKQLLSYNIVWIVAALFYIIYVITCMLHHNEMLDPFIRLAIATFSFYLIGACIFPNAKNKIAAFLLDNKTTQYIGRISYGIYIYHIIIAYILEPYVTHILFNLFGTKGKLSLLYYNSYLIKFPLYTIITIVVASLSFKYIEKPIAAFKNRVS